MAWGNAEGPKVPPPTMTAGHDLVLDAALRESTQDQFQHEAIAGVVAKLARHATPPVNIALFGAWGSGKSSFFGLLSEHLRQEGGRVRVAHYDAWKYGGRALKKHFVGSVADQLGLGGDAFERGLAHDQEEVHLDLWKWVKKNKRALLTGVALASFVAVAWFGLTSVFMWLVDLEGGYADAAKATVATFGTVLSLAFAALVFGPKVLESAVVSVKESAPETDDEFAKSFKRLVDSVVDPDKGERLVVFIDELDRCSPRDVVATLIDLRTFLDVEGCVFVVAADREVLERSLGEVPQANPVREDEPYYSTPGAFLDKIFQHQIPLPPLRPQALTRFARELVDDQGGLWKELRDAEPDDRLFLRVVYTLVPVHVRSPRRVKVLLNNYATNVRIAEARGIEWLGRAAELAYLTVLETEFPAVASDLVRIPRLLGYLRDEEAPPVSGEVQRVVNAYRVHEMSTSAPSDTAHGQVSLAAGPLLVDEASDSASIERANRVLNAHLRSYLLKTAAQDIPDPRPDLFYLQTAGQSEGLADPELGYVVDFAADLASGEVVEAFAGHTSATLAVGVRLLVQQAEAERGPGRSNIIEAACRLVERLDRDDLRAVAPIATGGVLAEVDSPDWSQDSTPGALLLGVVGARAELVNRLLARVRPSEIAKDGFLTRLTPVLVFATADQARLVHEMFSVTYRDFPEATHDALTQLPLGAALRLWFGIEDAVKEGLNELAPSTQSPAARARTAVPTPTTSAEAAVESSPTPAERFASLLAAVEARTEASGELVSRVLELGQRSGDKDLLDAVRERAGDALALISDPARLNLHALLGIERAPVADVAFWTEKLTEAETDPEQALRAFTRAFDAIPGAAAPEDENLSSAASALVSRLTAAHVPAVQQVLTGAINGFDWADHGEQKQRDLVYVVANSARSLVSDEYVDGVLAMGLADGLYAAGNLGEFVAEGISKIASLTAPSALKIEEHLDGSTRYPIATLRFRIAAAALTGTQIEAPVLLALKNEDGLGSEPLSEWLGLRPPVAEAMKALGSGMSVYRSALDQYAATVGIAERTALWIHCERKGYSAPALSAIGKHGISSQAIEHVGDKVMAATQQPQRDALVARLVAAKLIEHPAHAAATALVESLLETGVNGNAALAARVAIASGGAAHGRIVALRRDFDAIVAAKERAISKSDQAHLRSINLLSAARRSKRQAGNAIRGAFDNIFR